MPKSKTNRSKKKNPLNSEFYTVQEVAETLKVSVSTVRRAIKAKEIAATRIGTLGQIRVSARALDAYIESKTPAASSEVKSSPLGDTGGNGKSPRINGHRRSGLNGKSNGTTSDIQVASSVRVMRGTASGGTPWTVLNGDVLAAIREIQDGSVDCIVTSPPYYWQRDYEVDGQLGHEATIEGYVESVASVFRAAKRVLSPTGTLFLNLGDTYYSAKGRPHGRDDKHNGRQMMRRHLRAVDGPGLGLPRKSLIGIPWRVALAIQNDGWTLRSAVIWQRPGSLPEPTAKDRPWRTHEHVFIFSKQPRYYFNREGLKGEEDVWRIVARPENPGSHFAPYPRELVDRCLDVGCKRGGTVLDPFVGSGTTMLCALARRSPAIGIDIKPEYCDFIEERIDREFAKAKRGGELEAGASA